MDDRAAAGDPTLIAHRGFAGENPENTVVAVEAAAGVSPDAPGAATVNACATSDAPARRRADWIEIDVVPTADGDVVAFHDDDLSGRRCEGSDGSKESAADTTGLGFTDAAGVVWETDTATVTGANVLDSGESVPLFADVLDAIPPDVGVNVELKNPGDGSLRPGEKLTGDALAARKAVWMPFVERVLATTDGYGHDLLFSSFCEAALAAVREISARPVAPILSDSIDDGLAIAREYDATAIHPPMDMVRHTPFFDAARFGDAPDLVAVAHEAGRAVNAWTVRTWYQAARLEAAGVDGLIADYSTVMRS
jgi:glycerophosphoryl diester phosphodiesterase